MAYFPLFVDLTNKKCLVVGGGNVATRKVRMLLDFDARVVVVSKNVCNELKILLETSDQILLMKREFRVEDIDDVILVIAATNDLSLNNHISNACKMRQIPVNVVDSREECSFILPAYIKEKDVVAAFSSGGKSPVLTQYLKKMAKEYVTEELGDINAYLGNIRKEIQCLLPTEEQRKEVFEKILDYSLTNHEIPSKKETEIIISWVKAKHEL